MLVPQRHAALLQQQSDLIYAVLMPWIEGPTWLQVMQEKRELGKQESLALARSLAGILATLEQKGVAHCDLSAPNLLIPGLMGKGVEQGGTALALVDVEQLYGPGLERPEPLPAGSPGYAHRTADDGLWTAAADRFAGAVLLAEMLGWCDDRVRQAAYGESYFEPDEMQQPSARSDHLRTVLRERWGDGLAALFDQAWHSDTLADGPTFGEWLVALPEREPTAPYGIDSERQPGRLPPPEPPSADRTPSAGTPPEPSGSVAAIAALMAAAERLAAHGEPAGALATLEQARDLAPVGSGLRDAIEQRIRSLAAEAGDGSPPVPPSAVAVSETGARSAVTGGPTTCWAPSSV